MGWWVKNCGVSLLALAHVVFLVQHVAIATFAFVVPLHSSRRKTNYQLRIEDNILNRETEATVSNGRRRIVELAVSSRTSVSTSSSELSKSSSPNNDDDDTTLVSSKPKKKKATKIRPALVNFDDDDDEDDDTNLNDFGSYSSSGSSKFRRLKDIMWVRETLEDLTAAEFACSVEAVATYAGTEERKKQRRAVDYDKLLINLNRRMKDLGCEMPSNPEKIWDGSPICVLQEGEGMGTTVYTEDQRNALARRILGTRQALVEVLSGYKFELEQDSIAKINPLSSAFKIELDLPAILGEEEGDSNMTSTTSSTSKGNTATSFFIKQKEEKAEESKKEQDKQRRPQQQQGLGPKLYVRDDGTVDWDGALQDRAALREFGTSVWARINGQDPDSVNDEEDEEEVEKEGGGLLSLIFNRNATETDGGSSSGAKEQEVTAKIEDTPAIKEERAKLDALKKELKEMDKAHITLLNSAISAGQATANVNLATLEPAKRSKIRESAEALLKKEAEVSYETLLYELERIYTYLAKELYNPSVKGYIPLQDRLFVAEFGLLESQIRSFSRIMEQDNNNNANGDDENSRSNNDVDTDLLAVVTEQMNDFKRRLGIDYYVTGFSYDQDAIQRLFMDFISQMKKGIGFYAKGVNLFWNDILFSTSLIGRAAQGYTLEPREVRNIRRTFKDIITFIPVVIILIIPLSPVGHVLVFGAIQRFFPDFFPSCFTEQRQNLLELYESTEYSEYTVQETWEEKVSRLFEAFVFILGNFARNLYVTVDTNLNRLDSALITSEVSDKNRDANGSSSSDKKNINGDVNGKN